MSKPKTIISGLTEEFNKNPSITALTAVKAVKDKYGYNYDESLEEKVKPRLLVLLGNS